MQFYKNITATGEECMYLSLFESIRNAKYRARRPSGWVTSYYLTHALVYVRGNYGRLQTTSNARYEACTHSSITRPQHLTSKEIMLLHFPRTSTIICLGKCFVSGKLSTPGFLGREFGKMSFRRPYDVKNMHFLVNLNPQTAYAWK